MYRAPVLKDVLLDIFFDNHINPSRDWLNLPSEELTEKQFENFKRKYSQSKLSEKNKRERAIANGFLINQTLILADSKRHLNKNEYMELIASTEETIVEEVKGLSKGSCKNNIYNFIGEFVISYR